MRRNGDIAIIEAGDWRNTRLKERDVYVCVPPVGTRIGKVLVTTPEKEVVVFGGKRDTAVISMAELIANYKLPSGEDLNQANFGRLFKEDKKSLERVLPWTLLKVKPVGANNMVAVVVKGANAAMFGAANIGLAHIEADKHGRVIVCTGQDGVPMHPVEIVTGTVFARKYSLIAFPNEFNDVDTSIEMPTPLFETANAADKLVNKEKLEEMLLKIKGMVGGLETTYLKFDDKYVVSIVKGTKSITITYGINDGLDVTNGIARNIRVYDGADKDRLDSDKLAEKFGKSKAEFTIKELLGLITN